MDVYVNVYVQFLCVHGHRQGIVNNVVGFLRACGVHCISSVSIAYARVWYFQFFFSPDLGPRPLPALSAADALGGLVFWEGRVVRACRSQLSLLSRGSQSPC